MEFPGELFHAPVTQRKLLQIGHCSFPIWRNRLHRGTIKFLNNHFRPDNFCVSEHTCNDFIIQIVCTGGLKGCCFTVCSFFYVL